MLAGTPMLLLTSSCSIKQTCYVDRTCNANDTTVRTVFAVEFPANGQRPTMEDAADEGPPSTVEWVLHHVVRQSVNLFLRIQRGARFGIVGPTRVLQTQSDIEHVTKGAVHAVCGYQ